MAQTYENIINLVELQVRNFDAFPDDATKLQEQINAIYRYAVAISKTLPLSRMTLQESDELTSAKTGAGLLEFDLPADVNDVRPDLGVQLINFNGCDKIVPIQDSSPIGTVKAAASNFFQRGTFLFTFDAFGRKIYSAKRTAPVTVRYAPAITKAETGTYDTDEIDMDDNSIEVLVEAVAAQFTSVNARDLSASQIHSTLSQILSE